MASPANEHAINTSHAVNTSPHATSLTPTAAVAAASVLPAPAWPGPNTFTVPVEPDPGWPLATASDRLAMAAKPLTPPNPYTYPIRPRDNYRASGLELGRGVYGSVGLYHINDSPGSSCDTLGSISSAANSAPSSARLNSSSTASLQTPRNTDSSGSLTERRGRNDSSGCLTAADDLPSTMRSTHDLLRGFTNYTIDNTRSVAIKNISNFGQPALAEPALLQVLMIKDETSAGVKRLPHPYVVGLLDILASPGDHDVRVDLVLELGDQNLEQPHRWFFSNSKRYISQMAMGLRHCHNYHICHCDIKPANFIYFKQLDVIKLADFSVSEHVACRANSSRRAEFKYADNYRAIELWLGYDGFDIPAEYWAFAITILEIINGIPPFDFTPAFFNPATVQPAAAAAPVDPAAPLVVPAVPVPPTTIIIDTLVVLDIINELIDFSADDFDGLYLRHQGALDDYEFDEPIPYTLNADPALDSLLKAMLVANPRRRLINPLQHHYFTGIVDEAVATVKSCPTAMMKLVVHSYTPAIGDRRRDHIRDIMTVWLEYYQKYHDIYHLAINIYDRLTAVNAARPPTPLQALACLFIAQLYLADVHDTDTFCNIVQLANGAVLECRQMTILAVEVLNMISWRLCVTTAFDILQFELKSSKLHRDTCQAIINLLAKVSWVAEVYHRPPLQLIQELILYVTRNRFADIYEPISKMRHSNGPPRLRLTPGRR